MGSKHHKRCCFSSAGAVRASSNQRNHRCQLFCQKIIHSFCWPCNDAHNQSFIWNPNWTTRSENKWQLWGTIAAYTITMTTMTTITASRSWKRTFCCCCGVDVVVVVVMVVLLLLFLQTCSECTRCPLIECLFCHLLHFALHVLAQLLQPRSIEHHHCHHMEPCHALCNWQPYPILQVHTIQQ